MDLKKWQYTVLEYGRKRFEHEDDIRELLNKLGQEGWELISLLDYRDSILGDSLRFILKRPLNV